MYVCMYVLGANISTAWRGPFVIAELLVIISKFTMWRSNFKGDCRVSVRVVKCVVSWRRPGSGGQIQKDWFRIEQPGSARIVGVTSCLLSRCSVQARTGVSVWSLAFACLSVCFSARCLQNRCNQSPTDHQTWDTNCSTMNPGNPFILGSKGLKSKSRVTKTVPAWVTCLII